MGFNRNLFWLSGFLIFLFSISFVLYSTSPSPSDNTAISPQDSFSFQLGIFSKIIKLSGAQDLVSLITSIARRRHHHHHHRGRHKEKCDGAQWDSRLIQDYNVSLVLTVDLKGCANFSSVQKAVDAVPESSSDTTLIIIDSGTYRSLSLSLFIHPFCLITSILLFLSFVKPNT